jgi:heptosyltransferase II
MSKHLNFPKKILVRAPNWIGDQVLAYPFFYFLRKLYPQAQISVICVSWVEDIQFQDYINEVFVLPRLNDLSKGRKFLKLDEFAKTLRKRGPWDLAFSLPNSFSSAWLLWRAGALHRRGYAADARAWLLNDRVKWDPSSERHRGQAYVDLLPKATELGWIKDFWGIRPENELDSFTPGEQESFEPQKQWLKALPLSLTEKGFQNYWVLAPGATAESRTWPISFFMELAKKIHQETGWTGVIVGGTKEIALAAKLSEQDEVPLLDYTARGSVADLWPIFKNAQLTVCNESGLAHVAALCGSPVQIICGAADPKRTTPLGPGKVQVIFNPVECWPCEKNICTQIAGKKIQCLMGIHPVKVWEEIEIGILSKKKTSLSN